MLSCLKEILEKHTILPAKSVLIFDPQYKPTPQKNTVIGKLLLYTDPTCQCFRIINKKKPNESINFTSRTKKILNYFYIISSNSSIILISYIYFFS